jgi:hypothetical protein
MIMSRRAGYLLSIVMAGSIAVAAAPVSAETVDKLTYMTFSGRVQVPGAKLDPGTYRFRLANDTTSRNVIQVLSHDGRSVYAMFHTIPDMRMNVTSESTVTFRETPAGVPPAVKSLFYGGEHSGYEFVYPKGGPDLLAEVAPQPPASYSPVAIVTETTRTRAAESNAAASADAAASAEPAPVPEPAPAAEPAPAEPQRAETPAAPAAEPAPRQLPRTASPLPFVALGGFASLFVGLGAGAIRRFLA